MLKLRMWLIRLLAGKTLVVMENVEAELGSEVRVRGGSIVMEGSLRYHSGKPTKPPLWFDFEHTEGRPIEGFWTDEDGETHVIKNAIVRYPRHRLPT
jgi:hypothetical protein